MATTYKVLGQSNPSATTATTLYTVPSSTETVISTIVVANQASAAGSYRLAIRPDGESLAKKHYLAYDTPIPANATHTYTIGTTLNAADVITVYASSADQSFNAFGSEIA
jgi:glucose-6-phosphate dehydrogenase assembly protein OpcA